MTKRRKGFGLQEGDGRRRHRKHNEFYANVQKKPQKYDLVYWPADFIFRAHLRPESPFAIPGAEELIHGMEQTKLIQRYCRVMQNNLDGDGRVIKIALIDRHEAWDAWVWCDETDLAKAFDEAGGPGEGWTR